MQSLFFDIICDEFDQYMTSFCILESLDAASTRLSAIESRHIVSDILYRGVGGSCNWAYYVNFVEIVPFLSFSCYLVHFLFCENYVGLLVTGHYGWIYEH